MVDSLSSRGYTINYTRNSKVPYHVDMDEMLLRYEESDGLGNTIKIKALSRDPANPGWTVIPVRPKLLLWET